MTTLKMKPQCKQESNDGIDTLIQLFYRSFNNKDYQVNLQCLEDLFCPEAVIINHNNTPIKVNEFQTFITPRQKMFDDGKIVDFLEWESAATTQVFGNIAQRMSRYGKSGFINGECIDSRGSKLFQLMRINDSWKIVALSWIDD